MYNYIKINSINSEVLPSAITLTKETVDKVPVDVIDPIEKDKVGTVYQSMLISNLPDKDSGITVDETTKLFMKDNMAILGAYDFSNKDNEAIADFFEKLQEEYPEYELKLVEGQIPLAISNVHSVGISRDIKKETTVSTHLVCVSNYKDIVFENLKHSTLSLDDKLSILGYFGAGPEAYSYGRFDNSKFLTPEERSELYDYEEKVLYGGKEYCK